MTDTKKDRSALLADLAEARKRVAELERLLGAAADDDLLGPIQKLFEHLNHVLWVADAVSGAIIYASPAYEKIWGRSCQSLYDDLFSWHQAVHVDDRALVLEAIRNIRTDRFELEFRIVCPDGTIRWISNRGFMLFDDQKRPRHVVGMAEDISGRKLAEKALSREKHFTDRAIDSLPGMFYLMDETGRLLRWNRTVEAVTGYSAEEIARMHPRDFIDEPDQETVAQKILEVFVKGDANAEVTLRTRTGGKIRYFLTGKQVELDGLRCLVGMGINIEERCRLEEQLRQSQKIEAVGQLAGGLAHDFNNLLTVICSYSQLLVLRPPEPARRQEMLEQINMAGERVPGLTRQLLAFSRRTVLKPKVLDLNALVVELAKLLRSVVGENIRLDLDLAPGLDFVKVDPGQVELVIMNLAVNARDAMPQGGRVVIATANVDLDAPGGPFANRPGSYVMISVSDTGCGMSDDVLAHMFEPFFTTKEPGKGTGLGLATVYGFVRQSDGDIAVESAPGQGTTFKIYLPRATEPTPTPISHAELLMPSGTETILVVEDDVSVRILTRSTLQLHGYQVFDAGSGDEALTLASRMEENIDLLLTDVVMPGLGGGLLAERLRQVRPAIRVLFMSGYVDDAAVRRDLLVEDVALLTKPFTPSSLLRMVREVLDR